MFIDIVRPQDLFHTGIGTAFAEILVGGQRETTSAPPSMPDTSTSISPMSTGAPSISDLRDGG
jgi:hypothetical protein